MTPILYEFNKIPIQKQKNYIFQFIEDRKLTAIEHLHDFYECIYFFQGNTVQLLNGEKRVFEANSAILLRPSDVHCFIKQSKNVEVISLSVKKEEFELFANAYDPRLISYIHKREQPTLFSLSPVVFETLCDEKMENVTEYDCKLFLSYFLKGYIDFTNCLQIGVELPHMLAYAIEEMKKGENLQRGISAFTELSHYSQSHLSRLIKKYFDMSLKQYINELRLQSAYNDIILTRKSVEDIAEELGFMSFSHFNKIFKTKFSVTPAALRKSNGVWTV